MAKAEWTWDRRHLMERTVPVKCMLYRGGRTVGHTFMTWRCSSRCPCMREG